MRTRSSRFFMILLHLVGVCHRHRTLLSSQRSGILGVNPWPVQLESLFLSSFPQPKTRRRREDGDNDNEDDAIDHHPEDQTDDDFFQEEEEEEEQHLEPIWLQNRDDLTCLGPTGSFTECGDATLWFIQRHSLPQPPAIPGKAKRQFLSGIWQKDSDTQMPPKVSPLPLTGWTFQVVDRDYGELAADHQEEDQRKRNSNPSGLECLDRVDSAVQVLPCKRKWMRPTPSSGVWLIDDQGSMQVYDRRRQLQHQNSNIEPLCLHRGQANETDSVTLGSCADPFEGSENNETLPVRFSFVRYRAVTVTHDISVHSSGGHQQQQGHHASLSRSSKASSRNMPTSSPVRENAIPSSRDKAHVQAEDDWIRHTELMRSSQLLFHSMNNMNQKRDEEASPLNTLLQDTNPILLMGQNSKKKKTKAANPALLHPTSDEGINIGAATSMKMRPIQKHPYIEQAKDEVWTDPQTALKYFTDLSTYLGRDRAASGRHTLTGVGQYRKGYVIKVYGIAYYVSKRDVLADPTFATYARMSEDELRARPDFYTHLRQMNYRNEDDTAGKFERTLMLKTNMQLSAETMRSSLQADWRMLSDEMKDTLIGSSMEPRPADEDMLKLIQSPENPSRCSCSQVAPEEYQADPDCCARGTELVFTWLKNGDLEVRLNGRLMDTFPRPDIAEGIFFEYLRHDDPISTELRDRVVDGFPFLLAPLAQVRGVNLGQHHAKVEKENPIFRAVGEFTNGVSTQAAEMMGMMHRSMDEAAGHAGNAARSMQGAARSMQGAAQKFASDMLKRREMALSQSKSFPEAVLNMIAPNRRGIQTVTQWVEQNMTPMVDEDGANRKAPVGRVFGYPLSRWFGDTYYFAPDEIGPMKIHPKMNMTRKVFLALVHLYLLLLFIVSFPGSYSTRTKLVIRKSLSRDFSVSSASSLGARDSSPERSQPLCDRTGFASSRSSLLGRARNALRTQVADELPPPTPNEEAATSSLQKKSFSYFL